VVNVTSVRRRDGARPASFLVRRGAWTAECAQRYVDDACDAVAWTWSTKAKGRTTDALTELPGLRVLEVELAGVDDRSIGRITGLEELQLLDRTSEPEPVNLSGLVRLEWLTVAWSGRVQGVASLPRLTQLTVLGFDEPSLSSLVGSNPVLEWLTILSERARQPIDTEGLAGTPRLANLRIEGPVIRGLDGVRAAESLESVTMLGTEDRRVAVQGALDLSSLAGHPSLRWLKISDQGALRGLSELHRCPELRGVSVDERATSEGDLQELLDRSPLVVVERRHGMVHLQRPGD
jgi:hypothetical protein